MELYVFFPYIPSTYGQEQLSVKHTLASNLVISTLMTRTEMVLEMLVSSTFNHMTRLLAGEYVIEFSRRESFKLYRNNFTHSATLVPLLISQPQANVTRPSAGSKGKITIYSYCCSQHYSSIQYTSWESKQK